MSTRGRGLSADHPSHAPERILQDVVSFIESIGEQVELVGLSSGGANALHAAASTADGRFAQAIQEFTTDCVATDDEVASLASSGYYRASAPNAPALVRAFTHAGETSSVTGEPSALSRIGQPTLLVRGTASALRLFGDAVEHAAARTPDVRVRELPGAGHFVPIANPGLVAEELIPHFEETLPAR